MSEIKRTNLIGDLEKIKAMATGQFEKVVLHSAIRAIDHQELVIAGLQQRIAELEAAGKSLISEIGEGSAADWPELHLEVSKLRKLLLQQPDSGDKNK